VDDQKAKAETWARGWTCGAAGQATPKGMATNQYFVAGRVEGDSARKAALGRCEAHYGVKVK
jgi:hypothetical protein